MGALEKGLRVEDISKMSKAVNKLSSPCDRLNRICDDCLERRRVVWNEEMIH